MAVENPGYFETVWPRTPRQATVKELASRPRSLEGKRIAQLWDYMFRGDEIFTLLEEGIRKQYPDVTEARVAGLVARLIDLSEKQIDHATHHLFEPHLVSLSNIMDDITAIKKAEGTAAKEDLASWDMALLVFDLIRDEFGELYVREEATGPLGKLPKKTNTPKKP